LASCSVQTIPLRELDDQPYELMLCEKIAASDASGGVAIANASSTQANRNSQRL
jgi:hypothetical protein